MHAPADLRALDAAVCECRRCPRLVEWREEVARVKRASFADQEYWGRAVPGFGASEPSIWIVGLAPAAHGANRTGRMFTGDRSGDWLFASLYRTGLASQPTSTARGDGLTLTDVRITAAVHCAPPDNKPTPDEFANCSTWLASELRIVGPTVKVIVALGGLAWKSVERILLSEGWSLPRPRRPFGHAARFTAISLASTTVQVLGSYHPSQQNTFTRRLTEPMLDDVFANAVDLARS